MDQFVVAAILCVSVSPSSSWTRRTKKRSDQLFTCHMKILGAVPLTDN